MIQTLKVIACAGALFVAPILVVSATTYLIARGNRQLAHLTCLQLEQQEQITRNCKYQLKENTTFKLAQ